MKTGWRLGPPGARDVAKFRYRLIPASSRDRGLIRLWALRVRRAGIRRPAGGPFRGLSSGGVVCLAPPKKHAFQMGPSARIARAIVVVRAWGTARSEEPGGDRQRVS